MDKHFQPSITIEEFAAYLDGNLHPDEMKVIASAIESDEVMHNIMEASELADETLANYSDEDLALPEELTSVHFQVPFDEFDNQSNETNTVNEHGISLHSTKEEMIAHDNTNTIVDDHLSEDRTNGEFSLLTIPDISHNGSANKLLTHHVIDIDKEISLENKESINNNNSNTLIMGQFDNKENENLNAEIAARKVFGDESFGPNGGFDPVIYQGPEGVCAIRSQQIILRDYGIDISLEELKDFAIQNGWYDPSPDGGTPLWAIGNLLLSCNVPCEQSDGNTVYDLVNELAQGHRIIVGVDANELWADREHNLLEGAKEWFKDCFSGETPNHALVVAGVDVNPDNPNDVKVILTDPGTGDLRIEYDLDDFMDAWEDSNCFMVSTSTPAPLQYDPENNREIPSNFAVENYIDTNSIPLSPENVILPGQMAAMCAGAHYSEGHLETVPVDGKDVAFDEYAEAVEKAQQYKSAIGGGPGMPGQDHFDKDKFMSSLKNLLGLGNGGDQGDDEEIDTDPDDNETPGSSVPSNGGIAGGTEIITIDDDNEEQCESIFEE